LTAIEPKNELQHCCERRRSSHDSWIYPLEPRAPPATALAKSVDDDDDDDDARGRGGRGDVGERWE